MQTITPCLWCTGNAAEAREFYLSVFEDSQKVSEMKTPDGALLAATIRLRGQEIMLLNGPERVPFSPAVSLFVACKTQAEIDLYWARLLADGGAEQQCGWLNDKYGLCWQIAPEQIGALFQDPDPAKANAAIQAMMGMVKLDIAQLEKAHREA